MSADLPIRRTEFRTGLLWAGALIVGAGCVLLGLWLGRLSALGLASAPLALLGLGWGALAEAVGVAVGTVAAKGAVPAGVPHGALLGWGSAVFLLGWGVLALGIRTTPLTPLTPSPAVGAKLHPSLSQYRDFYWSTLAAYGGGILLAEVVMVLAQLGLTTMFKVPPAGAFGVAILVGVSLAFAAGFAGAAWARRMSVPEATLGILYLGIPVPLFLSLLHTVPALQLSWGYRFREVTYLAEMLGARPEIGYWLVYTLLVLFLVLGMTTGFVITATGRVDLRAGYELFIARRHVSVFRPRLLIGALLVLLLLVIPPLLIYFIVRSTENAVEKTRIKALGMGDPLAATEELHRTKQVEMTPTGMMTALSVGGVGLGVWALIVVLSVMSGFELDLQEKILGTNAHAMVLKYSGDMPEYQEVLPKVRKVEGVTGATPFILNEVMITSEGNISGVIIKGIDPSSVEQVTDLRKNATPRDAVDHLDHPEKIKLRRIAPSGGAALDEKPAEEDEIIDLPEGREEAVVLPGILLGKELAASLRVVTGDRVNVVSPLGDELGPQGPIPKSRPFRVAGIVYTGMYEYDSKFVYIRLQEAQTFFNVKGASGIELKVADIDDARRISRSVVNALDGYPYRARDWGEMNKNLFSALRLEKLVMGIILSIIIVVAAGMIVATVIMLVLEKRKEIAVLKALGVPDGGIVKIFLAEGLQIGIAGGLLGLVSGLAWCFFIDKVGIHLNPEVYYIPKLPVKVEPVQTAVAVLIAILVTYLGSIYPALKASRVEPVEGLKAE